MRPISRAACLAVATAVGCSPARAPAPESAEASAAGEFVPAEAERAQILTAVQRVFDALQARDPELFREATEPGPFLWARVNAEGLRVTVHLRRLARDAVEIELQLERE